MTDAPTFTDDTVASERLLAEWMTELSTVLIGQPAAVESLLIGLLVNGHVLLEGPCGVGKRVAARALAHSFGAAYTEVPSIPAPSPAALHPRLGAGPTGEAGHIVLITGLERACLATQAAIGQALLRAQADSDDTAAPPAEPYMLIASRNPSDAAGVAPLAEALLDRFTLSVALGFPGLEDETRMVRELGLSSSPDMLSVVSPQALLSASDLRVLRKRRGDVRVDEQLVGYAVRIVRGTRYNAQLQRGASTRAAVDLVRCAQARAMLQGRDYALPADIKACAPAILHHRLQATVSQRLDGIALAQIIAEQLEQLSAPRP